MESQKGFGHTYANIKDLNGPDSAPARQSFRAGRRVIKNIYRAGPG